MGFEKKMHWMIISRFLPSQTPQTLLALSWWPYLFHWETRMNLKNSISPSLKLPPDLHLCPRVLSRLRHKALNIGALLGVRPSAAMANSDFSCILQHLSPVCPGSSSLSPPSWVICIQAQSSCNIAHLQRTYLDPTSATSSCLLNLALQQNLPFFPTSDPMKMLLLYWSCQVPPWPPCWHIQWSVFGPHLLPFSSSTWHGICPSLL